MSETKTDDLNLTDLGHYHGTEQYHNVMGTQVTDGIAYVMSNGYSWVITDAVAVLRYEKKVAAEEFVCVILKVTKNTAVITYEDGNGEVLFKQEYNYTDAKRDLKLFYTNKVLMLAGEY